MRENATHRQVTLWGSESAVVMAAAHELKSPLTLITYIAQILGDKSLNLSEQEKLQYLQRLKTVSERTLRLTQQITKSYRLVGEDPTAALNLEPVNVQSVCESALHELTPYAFEYGQRLILKPSRRSRVVVANRDILHDVIVNLLDNAVRHSEAPGDVTVDMHAHEQWVRLNVHDDGTTINNEHFLRLKQTLGKQPQPLSGHAGTSGLGLYIVDQLMGGMGGMLGMARAREGTTFFIDLLRSQQLRLW